MRQGVTRSLSIDDITTPENAHKDAMFTVTLSSEAPLLPVTVAYASVDDSRRRRSRLSFEPHVIPTDARCARSVYAADLDGDGDLDVLSASFNDNQIAWYENDWK